MKTYEKIKQLRENREITQKEISNALDINVSVYNKIELGIRPLREEELTAIADFFNVSIDYLTGRTDNPTTPSNNQKEDENVKFRIIILFFIFDTKPTQ